MTPDYVAVRPEWTIGRALEHIRLRAKNSETINVTYVVDFSWKLIGASLPFLFSKLRLDPAVASSP